MSKENWKLILYFWPIFVVLIFAAITCDKQPERPELPDRFIGKCEGHFWYTICEIQDTKTGKSYIFVKTGDGIAKLDETTNER